MNDIALKVRGIGTIEGFSRNILEEVEADWFDGQIRELPEMGAEYLGIELSWPQIYEAAALYTRIRHTW